MPASMPPMIRLPYRMPLTLMPTVSAAVGCSPTARTRSPHRVLNRPTWTAMIAAYVMYRNSVESKKIGPMIGMSPSPGTLMALNVLALL